MPNEELSSDGSGDDDALSIVVTAHAKRRFKQRLGLPKSACQKQAERAFMHGFTHAEARGSAKRYLSKLFLEHRTSNNTRVYGGAIYLFSGHTLITVFALPDRMRNGFKRAE